MFSHAHADPQKLLYECLFIQSPMAQDATYGDETHGDGLRCETTGVDRSDGPNDRTVERDVEALKALGSDTRYRIVRHLVAADEERCVCELTPRFEVSDSAVSHALSDLADAGLVSRRKQGTWRYYRPTDRAASLIDALDASRGEDR